MKKNKTLSKFSFRLSSFHLPPPLPLRDSKSSLRNGKEKKRILSFLGLEAGLVSQQCVAISRPHTWRGRHTTELTQGIKSIKKNLEATKASRHILGPKRKFFKSKKVSRGSTTLLLFIIIIVHTHFPHFCSEFSSLEGKEKKKSINTTHR